MATEDSDQSSGTKAGDIQHSTNARGHSSDTPALSDTERNVVKLLQHKIIIREEEHHLVIDISDNTGGLSLKLMWAPHEATRFAQAMLDRARFMVSKAADDPQRTAEQTFAAGD